MHFSANHCSSRTGGPSTASIFLDSYSPRPWGGGASAPSPPRGEAERAESVKWRLLFSVYRSLTLLGHSPRPSSLASSCLHTSSTQFDNSCLPHWMSLVVHRRGIYVQTVESRPLKVNVDKRALGLPPRGCSPGCSASRLVADPAAIKRLTSPPLASTPARLGPLGAGGSRPSPLGARRC